MRMGGGWVLDVDIRKFFDSLSHDHLREILARRMQDGVIKRLIGKWLQAGVMEEGVLTHSDVGTPQGGVVSPLLANIYLHEVLDVVRSGGDSPASRASFPGSLCGRLCDGVQQ